MKITQYFMASIFKHNLMYRNGEDCVKNCAIFIKVFKLDYANIRKNYLFKITHFFNKNSAALARPLGR